MLDAGFMLLVVTCRKKRSLYIKSEKSLCVSSLTPCAMLKKQVRKEVYIYRTSLAFCLRSSWGLANVMSSETFEHDGDYQCRKSEGFEIRGRIGVGHRRSRKDEELVDHMEILLRLVMAFARSSRPCAVGSWPIPDQQPCCCLVRRSPEACLAGIEAALG